jgi:pimeloyl-ACP methyl ester carboxylesterase
MARPRFWLGHPIKECSWQLELLGLLSDPIWCATDVHVGDGSPILLVPGFLSGDSSFIFMRSWLRRVGYRTYVSGIIWNVDCADRAVRRLEKRLVDLADRSGRTVHIVAHSRGGLFARALAKRNPEPIAQVITLGSPLGAEFDCSLPVAAAVIGARAAQRVVRPEARANGCFTIKCLCGYSSDLSGRLQSGVRLTSIYTVDDGVVRPTACQVPDAECVAVRGSHLGLVVNAEVYRYVGKLLANAGIAGER